MAITNSSYEPLPVSLGYNREGGFIFTVKRPDGSVKETPRKITKDNLTLLANFNVDAQKTYTQQLILNEWYDFNDPGVYEISASLMKGRRQDEPAPEADRRSCRRPQTGGGDRRRARGLLRTDLGGFADDRPGAAEPAGGCPEVGAAASD